MHVRLIDWQLRVVNTIACCPLYYTTHSRLCNFKYLFIMCKYTGSSQATGWFVSADKAPESCSRRFRNSRVRFQIKSGELFNYPRDSLSWQAAAPLPKFFIYLWMMCSLATLIMSIRHRSSETARPSVFIPLPHSAHPLGESSSPERTAKLSVTTLEIVLRLFVSSCQTACSIQKLSISVVSHG